MESKRILVIDDSEKNVSAALVQLDEHDLRVSMSYVDGLDMLVGDSWTPEVVLSDLLMPAESQMLGPEGQRFVGQEIGVGLVIGMAAAEAGIPHVAVITDANLYIRYPDSP